LNSTEGQRFLTILADYLGVQYQVQQQGVEEGNHFALCHWTKQLGLRSARKCWEYDHDYSSQDLRGYDVVAHDRSVHKQDRTMRLKRFFWLATLLLALSIAAFLSVQPVQAAITSESKITLFTADEWTALETKSSELPETLLIRLNSQRNRVGEAALKIVHPDDKVSYGRTDSVFVSPRDGGGYVYGFIIHWFRDVALGLGKNLTTKISWEIVDNKHFQAKVYEDDSIFKPINPEKLDSFFGSLIPSKP
jgi:hypothetical protein